MNKINFDSTKDGLEIARSIVLKRLKKDLNWNQLDRSGEGYENYVEYIGDRNKDMQRLHFLGQEVFWQLMFQGVILPGHGANQELPFFHITEYGQKVLNEEKIIPHDPTGYLDNFQNNINNPDPIVEFYLTESLQCFNTGNFVASIVMLGVASEKMFLLLCDAVSNSLTSKKEMSKFQNILNKISMKEKQDWLTRKIINMDEKIKKQLPENIETTLMGIFSLIRLERNDLGHPNGKGLNVTRDDAYVYLRLFPSYCKVITQVIQFLKNNKI